MSGEKSTPAMKPSRTIGAMWLIRSPEPKPTSSTRSAGSSASDRIVSWLIAALERLKSLDMTSLPKKPEGSAVDSQRTLALP